jgi:hypothetical protein
MPHVNPLKMRLIQQDSIQSQASLFGRDSGIAFDEIRSGLSVGVIPEGLIEIFQGDLASGGSGMLGSEPQSEVDAPEAIMLGPHVSSASVSNGGHKVPENSLNGKLVAILNPFDKKLKDWRTLKQHYYPEGGWGWVIVIVTLCVQIISHGLQFALAMYVIALPKSSVISRRLNAPVDQTGKNLDFCLRV